MRVVCQYFLFLLTGALVLSSCGDEPTCVDRDSSIVKIDFLDDDGEAKSITLTRLSAIGNEDGFPEFADSTFTTLQLPLNPGARNATYILFQSGATDTISLGYNVVAQLISPECGLDAAFSNLKIDSTTFENAVLVSDIVNEQIETNIEITL